MKGSVSKPVILANRGRPWGVFLVARRARPLSPQEVPFDVLVKHKLLFMNTKKKSENFTLHESSVRLKLHTTPARLGPHFNYCVVDAAWSVHFNFFVFVKNNLCLTRKPKGNSWGLNGRARQATKNTPHGRPRLAKNTGFETEPFRYLPYGTYPAYLPVLVLVRFLRSSEVRTLFFAFLGVFFCVFWNWTEKLREFHPPTGERNKKSVVTLENWWTPPTNGWFKSVIRRKTTFCQT